MATTIKKDDSDKIHSGSSDKSKYRIEIDREACIGAASCIAIGANTFTIDDKNKVLIIEGEWDNDEIVMAAAQSCPVFAIKIFDIQTGKQIFPDA